jgi:hypothetical protein
VTNLHHLLEQFLQHLDVILAKVANSAKVWLPHTSKPHEDYILNLEFKSPHIPKS